jgi:hypothetical protein
MFATAESLLPEFRYHLAVVGRLDPDVQLVLAACHRCSHNHEVMAYAWPESAQRDLGKLLQLYEELSDY